MKRIILFIIFLILVFFCVLMCSCSSSKKIISTGTEFQYSWKRAAVSGALCGASGAAWGVHETVVHHADRIPQTWNQQYWDARISWRNKYRSGNPDLGPAFPGSTTIFSGFTDAKHGFATLHRTTLFGGGLVLTIGERRPAWHYILDAGISFVAFSIGFHGVYDIAFPK